MDPNRDNPLKRFSAFWIAFLMVSTFGIGGMILRPLTHAKVDTAYEMKSEERLAVKKKIESEQAAALSKEKLEEAISLTAESLNKAPTPGAMKLPGAQ
jgi:hypothetical protein